jgi:lysophospholipase L1-like esterase
MDTFVKNISVHFFCPMKIRIVLLLSFLVTFHLAMAQAPVLKWWNPQSSEFAVLEGQAWPKELKNPYDRLPARAEEAVTKAVWNLSTQSAGLMLRFRSNAPEITIRYTVSGRHAMQHMPATGVSGVDLYAVTTNGEQRWSAGRYSFGDTIVYNFKGIEPNDQFHKLGREYRLFLPLYNQVKWMEIGVPETSTFTPLAVRPDKPVVVYGTSIAQGACASRPGMAWTSILGRKLDHPLINLGFSGNGKLDKAIIDLLYEIDAKIYVLDCLPNLTIQDPKSEINAEEIKKRINYAVRTLRAKRPEVPILLAEHAGYTDEGINPVRRNYFEVVNQILRESFDKLKADGIDQIYLLPKKDFDQDIETMVDGTHPSDLGMMRYAQGYEQHIRSILNEPVGNTSTTTPVTQLRELGGYDWDARHRLILELNKKEMPKTVVIGNSITHFWGGSPEGHRVSGADSWTATFGDAGVRNMGYGWDRIENVLWRVYHGELDGYQPRQIFVNIGTNNLDYNSDDEIVKGWELLITAIKSHQPNAELVMIGLYPRRKKEERVATLNSSLAALAGMAQVKFIDPGKVFLKKDRTIDESLFSDGLHPNAKGYTLLGGAIKPFVK